MRVYGISHDKKKSEKKERRNNNNNNNFFFYHLEISPIFFRFTTMIFFLILLPSFTSRRSYNFYL